MTRTEKIKRIVEAMEIFEMIDMQLLAGRDEAVRVTQKAQQDIAARYGSAFSNQSLQTLEATSSAFAKEIADMWSTEQFVSLFESEYGRDMTDEELDEICDYYSSPIGKKDVRAAKLAIAFTMGHMIQLRREKFDPLYQRYCARLQQIFADGINDDYND